MHLQVAQDELHEFCYSLAEPLERFVAEIFWRTASEVQHACSGIACKDALPKPQGLGPKVTVVATVMDSTST